VGEFRPQRNAATAHLVVADTHPILLLNQSKMSDIRLFDSGESNRRLTMRSRWAVFESRNDNDRTIYSFVSAWS
jgi:hypothetical protein